MTTVSPTLSGIGCADDDGIDPSSEVDPVGTEMDGSSGGIGVVTLDVAVDAVGAAPVCGVGCDGIGIGGGCGACIGCTCGIGGGCPYSMPGYCPPYLIPGY